MEKALTRREHRPGVSSRANTRSLPAAEVKGPAAPPRCPHALGEGLGGLKHRDLLKDHRWSLKSEDLKV